MVGEILSILRSFAVQTRIFAKECNIIAVGYVRSTAQDDENLNRLRNKCAMTCDLFPRPFGERVRERGYLAASLLSRLAAFTLAEVLITLGIIGVVAALTIPTLVANYQEKVATVRLKKVYSTISNAYTLLLEKEGDPTQWNDVEDFVDISEKFAKYINKAKVCNVGDTGCFKHVPRKDLTGKVVDSLLQGGAIVLSDGAVIGFDSQVSLEESLQCNSLNHCFIIVTDINGDKRPNQWGVDTFVFQVGTKRILPRGAASTHGADNTCIPTGGAHGQGWWNGSGCGAWVIYNENMNYLKCIKGNNNYCEQKYYF